MLAYVGKTRSRKLIQRLNAEGFGECCQPRELPPKRHPWFLDNGAFAAWRAGRGFDIAAWLGALQRAGDGQFPDFAVAPDVVAGGRDSLVLSSSWLEEMRRAKVPAYLAVQDGMSDEDVSRTLAEGFDGVFVGGSLPWKLATGAHWVDFAHARQLPCHIGRVGTARRVEWAAECGADSIDSCLPLWSTGNLNVFCAALRKTRIQSQFWRTQ